MKKLFFALTLSVSMSTSTVSASGVPTVDAAAIAHALHQVSQLRKNLQNQADQIRTMIENTKLPFGEAMELYQLYKDVNAEINMWQQQALRITEQYQSMKILTADFTDIDTLQKYSCESDCRMEYAQMDRNASKVSDTVYRVLNDTAVNQQENYSRDLQRHQKVLGHISPSAGRNELLFRVVNLQKAQLQELTKMRELMIANNAAVSSTGLIENAERARQQLAQDKFYGIDRKALENGGAGTTNPHQAIGIGGGATNPHDGIGGAYATANPHDGISMGGQNVNYGPHDPSMTDSQYQQQIKDSQAYWETQTQNTHQRTVDSLADSYDSNIDPVLNERIDK